MKKNLLFGLVILSVVFSLSFGMEGFQPVKAKNGMVVCGEPLACDVALQVLKEGGNAVDASVALAFTLAVTYPNAGNLGGGGFMIYRSRAHKVFALDYREKAPLAATQNMYLDSTGAVIEKASTLGYRAAGVPGTVAGLWEAHQQYGHLKWKRLIKPAIELAKKGFIIDAFQAAALQSATNDFNKFPSSKKIFTHQGAPFKAGERFVQKDLAVTLKRIAERGAKGFYSGETAQRIARDMRRNGGLITEKDLRLYKPVWRKAVKGSYRGYTVYSMPPPSSGGIILTEILNTLELFHISDMEINSSPLIRLWVEIERQAYADRAQWLGDPDFVQNPQKRLTSKQYAKQIKRSISYFKAGCSDSIKIPEINGREAQQTTHFSITDRWGNAVSNTFTLNGNYGSRVVADGTGVLLNNEMDDFSIKPGFPNSYGLVGSQANAVASGKRMLSSMTPTIITKNDTLFMVIGGPGGSKIITGVAQVISNVIDHRMNMRQAIENPRFHHQWKPDIIFMERDRFSKDTRNNLEGSGYKLEYKTYMGYVQGILYHSKTKKYHGWSDPRSDGKAAGY